MQISNYDWVEYYNNFAKILLQYKYDRQTLINMVKQTYEEIGIRLPTLEKDNDIVDIDPFTVFGLFNKNKLTESNRFKILSALSEKMGISTTLPTNFDGIPTVNNQNATFYYFVDERKPDDIDNLWGLFEFALKYVNDKSEEVRKEFCRFFNAVINAKGNNNSKITMGLFWISAKDYLNLDSRSQRFIYETNQLPTNLIKSLPKVTSKISAETYLTILESVQSYFNNPDSDFHNFVELSCIAWKDSNEVNEQNTAEKHNKDNTTTLGDDESNVVHFWLYAPGRNAYKWDEYYNKGIMAIGWGYLGDLKQYASKSEMKEEMQKSHGSESSHKNDAHATWQFANEIKKGDIIFVKKGISKIIGRGIVTSDYYFDDTVQDTHKHIRNVNWTNFGEWEHPKNKAVTKTLTDITPYKDYVESLEALFLDDDDDFIEEKQPKFDKYTEREFLEQVFMNSSDYDILKSLILSKKNIILQGAPGVGKTFAAKRLAYSIMEEKDINRVMMVQFHQSYSYEDFIVGYRPKNDGSFELKEGPFYKFCKKAENDDENKYFFIIDEINRGNISKIFGELFMLIENDKRGIKLPLMYGNEDFSVPENVYIIGMMNTADRSLAMLDYALRRRFAFFEFVPAFETEGFRKYRESKANVKFDRLIVAVERINEMIQNDITLGKGFRIGHSFFCTENEIDDKWLNSVVNYEILPLLDEYWFDDHAKVIECERLLKEAIK